MTASSEIRFFRGRVYEGISCHKSALSPASHRFKRDRVKARRWFRCVLPARGMLHSTHLANICRSVHDSVELSQAVGGKVLARHRAQSDRSSLGTWRSVGTNVVWTVSKDGRRLWPCACCVWLPVVGPSCARSVSAAAQARFGLRRCFGILILGPNTLRLWNLGFGAQRITTLQMLICGPKRL